MHRSAPFLLLVSALVLSGCQGGHVVDASYTASLATPYQLDSGDRLRVVVFAQENLTNSYTVDDSGHIAVPLIGSVPARGRTARELEASIASSLRNGYLRDPSVTVEVETYRPFYILGEVRNPGQYAYVNGMTAKTAVAIAGGFTPRAVTGRVTVSRQQDGIVYEDQLPVDAPVMPGDTIQVPERWF